MAETAVRKPMIEGEDPDDLRALFRLMLLTRRFEESLYRKYREGKIGGYLHRYDGQEALVVGVIPLLTAQDYVLCTYRDHGHALACGVPPAEVMAELLGKATGCAGGKGGSMHLIDPSRGFLGGDGIVGGPVPVSAGVGFAIKYRGSRQVCVCYFGDGAMNQGGVHEAFNMAGLYKLPVLYVLENNGYAMGTAVSRSTGQPDMLAKAAAHGIAAERVDGMDVLAVRSAVRKALDRIRSEGVPYFMEMTTYRFVGHGIADNAQQQRFYRSEDEIVEWKARDPLCGLEAALVGAGILDSAQIDEMEAQVKAQIDGAIRFAEESPDPDPATLYDSVYA